MKFFRLLLFPIAMAYAAVIALRNFCFNKGILKTQSFTTPIILVGNIAVGGTGKTPMVESLIRLLRNQYHIAVLSRGYGRRTNGYILATDDSQSTDIGDEPMQYKRKFKDITVAVAEKRKIGIEALKDTHDVIILDDAYQHRCVKAGISIVLFDYNTFFETDYMLPMGNLREPISNKSRADIIIITKTPKIFSPMERRRVEAKLHLEAHQMLAYSYISYTRLHHILGTEEHSSIEVIDAKTEIFLLTGLANTTPLENFIEARFKKVHHIDYPDHYQYKASDVDKLRKVFEANNSALKMIITTEKDAMRLQHPDLAEAVSGLPIFYLSIEAHIHEADKAAFNDKIINYVRTNSTHNGLPTEANLF